MVPPNVDQTDGVATLNGEGNRKDVAANVSALVLLRALLKAKRSIAIAALAGGALFLGYALLTRTYDANSTLYFAAAPASIRGLSGLAGQFGVNLGTQEEPSLDFYEELFGSRDVLLELAKSEFPVQLGEQRSQEVKPYYRLLGFKPGALEQDPMDVYDAVRDKISVSVDRDAGLLRVRTSAARANLAEELNRKLLQITESLNMSRRQSRASEERRFIQKRVEQAKTELTVAEDSLEAFYAANRTINGPHLQMIAGRLQRTVQVRQQVFLTLNDALLQAQMEEIRDTPVFAVVESPEGSAQLHRSLIGFAVAGMLFAAFFVAFCVLAITIIRAQRVRDPATYEGIVKAAGYLGRWLDA